MPQNPHIKAEKKRLAKLQKKFSKILSPEEMQKVALQELRKREQERR